MAEVAAEVAKKKGMPLFRVITPGGFELHFLHEEGYAKAAYSRVY
jgi:pyridoxal/pyridoxine/pyridoxamine kinase